MVVGLALQKTPLELRVSPPSSPVYRSATLHCENTDPRIGAQICWRLGSEHCAPSHHQKPSGAVAAECQSSSQNALFLCTTGTRICNLHAKWPCSLNSALPVQQRIWRTFAWPDGRLQYCSAVRPSSSTVHLLMSGGSCSVSPTVQQLEIHSCAFP